MNKDRRHTARCILPGHVEIEGGRYRLMDMTPFGCAVLGQPETGEAPNFARIVVLCGDARFTITRNLDFRYFDAVRNVTGFEFVDATADETDIVLGIVLANELGAGTPATVSPRNLRALEILKESGTVICLEGGWVAHVEQ